MANSSSPLLKLPAELRREIYRHVLHCDSNSLQYRYWKTKADAKPIFHATHKTKECPRSWNQIQYVCRQLYTETRTLELKYNSLIFRQTAAWELGAWSQFSKFVEALPKNKLEWLRTVTLSTSPNTVRQFWCPAFVSRQLPSIISLSRFCDTHPHITCNYIIPHFTIHDRFEEEDTPLVPDIVRFIEDGVYINRLLRNKDVAFLIIASMNDHFDSEARILRRGRHVQEYQASNLRFWPELRTFDEKEFRKWAVRGEHLWSVLEGRMETWVQHAKEWIEKGI
jgi:hypothetical protein